MHTQTAVFHTTLGDITINLFGNHAPKTVKNFVGLAEGSQEWSNPRSGEKQSGPLYKDVPFHRVIAGFMIQVAIRWAMALVVLVINLQMNFIPN